ncbi:MAG: cation diffusion facilitator family transporter [Ornithinimicrobium sp.]|uniref:cation diffusion facilitator family transporter n=1 Tax=Ornithinimicrobium sp. TaxID=1977084 RepID=UPI003D9B3D10
MSGHHHGHVGATHRWRLQIAFVLVAAFFGVELAAGLISGSLALLSDAGHMAADVVALGAALLATRLAMSTPADGRRTFGAYRAEVFASGLAVLLMLGVSTYILIEAARRFGSSAQVASAPMLVVGAIGLVVNLAALLLLRGGAGESLNVKGAYLEVVADTLGSVGVIVAGVLVATTGQAWWDTAVAVAIALFVGVRAVLLSREVLSVLGQRAPEDLPPAVIMQALGEVQGVTDVHDLHVWTLTSGMHVASAHLVVADEAHVHAVLDRGAELMRDRFGVEHATLQVEPESHTRCSELSW